MSRILGAEWTEREMKMAAQIVRVMRKARDQDEAINVVALIAKTVIETDPQRTLYPWSRR